MEVDKIKNKGSESIEPFNEYIDFIINTRIDPKFKSSVQELLDIYSSCFQHSKSNNFELAQGEFLKAIELEKYLNEEVRLWVSALNGGNISYYLYKFQQFEASIEQTQKNIYACQTAYNKWGCWGFFWGEIQQCQNLARIFLRLNNLDEYIRRTGETLPRMYFVLSNWEDEIIDIWEREIFREIGYEMLIQVLTETMQTIMVQNRLNEIVLKDCALKFLNNLNGTKFKGFELPNKFLHIDVYINLYKKVLQFGPDSLQESDLENIVKEEVNKDLKKILFNILICIK